MERGSLVRIEVTKWGERPHWVYAGRWLGHDDHGGWIGFRAGSRFSRPGRDYTAPYDQVALVPAAGPEEQRGWLATFHAAGGPVQVYVDITTPPVWDADVVHAVDLDLDVVRGSTGSTWVEDEDEFAEHRVTLGYPAALVAAALASCERVEHAVRAGHAPYDGSHRRWLDVLAALD
jgi:hypothetical protein